MFNLGYMNKHNWVLFVKSKGKIKYYNKRKGYGFINSCKNTSDDIFFHFTYFVQPNAENMLEINFNVVFDLCKGEKGFYAINTVWSLSDCGEVYYSNMINLLDCIIKREIGRK